MSSYQTAYAALNARQRQAVDQTDGPLLVLAGPGTGKTQLLGTRAAHIVAQGSANPANVLCLTYTEAGATEMRVRLTAIMGPAGGEVAVHTFHSFGGWLIGQYPELFSQQRSLQPLDDLGRHRIFETVLSALPLRHPLAVRDGDDKYIRQGGVQELIKVLKQAGLDPTAVRQLLADNKQQYDQLQPLIDEIFSSTLRAKRLPAISQAVATYQAQFASGTYGALLLQSLAQAVSDSEAIGKTKPLGSDWRGKHLEIKDGRKILKSAARHDSLLAAIAVYETYQTMLAAEGRYDYEDMVLWAVRALQQNQDLRMEIAERFQYIMVDEYQDTNGAQNALLDAILSANPLDAPNIMVVGDDDQAIMRFQGAELSGLLQFITTYQPAIVTLVDNYRSSQAILDASRAVMVQTDERLETSLPDMAISKVLTARNEPPQTVLEHQLYVTETAEYQGVAEQVKALLDAGTPADTIAIIARKHKYLVALVPFLQASGITVNYDYREDILSDRRILELLQLAQYVTLLSQRPARAEQFLGGVLSGGYWQIDAVDLYRLAAAAKLQKMSWLDTMLAHEDNAWQQRAEWLLAAAAAVQNENFTTGLDMLVGRTPLLQSTTLVTPFSNYFDVAQPAPYISLISHLLRLREAVLQSRPQASGLQDMLETVAEYRRSGIKLVDDNPLLKGDQAGVTLLSAHGAKGREFEHVIVLSAVNSIWGSGSGGSNTRIYLPENLPLYPAGDSESDRLRLLYVAMTRAKSHLLFTSHQQTNEGKPLVPLSYLPVNDEATDWWQPTVMPLAERAVITALETSWNPAALPSGRSLQNALQPLLAHYRLSPTALGSFLNICYDGPQSFLERSVLGFPSSYTPSSALGQAAHSVLEQAYQAFAHSQPFDGAEILARFNQALDATGLPPEELQAVRAHGEQFLPSFVASFAASDFSDITSTEQYFTATLPVGSVPFGGKIDALVEHGNALTVLDYKTGKPPLPNWETRGLSPSKKIGLHFYRQQLICYKLLLDTTRSMQHKTVSAAELIFIEPAEDHDETIRLSITDFTGEELDRTARLIQAVYTCLLNGNLPDVSGYSKDLTGIIQFEDDLLNQ